MDIDGYKVVKVNVYKLSPTRLQPSNLPVFSHSCLFAGGFDCTHANWGYVVNSADGECLVGWASINSLALFCSPKESASFLSDRWNTGIKPDLAFSSVDSDSRLPDRGSASYNINHC